jgi:hypothetical protein
MRFLCICVFSGLFDRSIGGAYIRGSARYGYGGAAMAHIELVGTSGGAGVFVLVKVREVVVPGASRARHPLRRGFEEGVAEEMNRTASTWAFLCCCICKWSPGVYSTPPGESLHKGNYGFVLTIDISIRIP